MFVDQKVLVLRAGKGGNGIVSWLREKFIPKGGPTGGNGGDGGPIIIRATRNQVSLDAYRNLTIIKGQEGAQGGTSAKQGRSGRETIVEVPIGTYVKDAKTKEILADLTEDNQEIIICQGGKGGRGNLSFKSSTNQAPNTATEGTKGEEKSIELELKLIADVGLVGFPNAGKSTLIQSITHSRAKVGDYPFTTLKPNLGYLQFDDYSRICFADIPGIIEGAHENRGLGLEFLKHIERTSTLIFVIDASPLNRQSPLEDFVTLQKEIAEYNPELASKPFLVALNKIDTEESSEKVADFIEKSGVDKSKIFPISAQQKIGLEPFIEKVRVLSQRDGKKF